MGNIGIIGAGDLGANIAFFLAEQHVGFTFLYHDPEGIAVGKSLDLLEAAPVRKYDTYIVGTSKIEDIIDKDVVVLAVSDSTTTETDELTRSRTTIDAIKPKLDLLSKVTAPIVVASEPYDVVTSYLATVLPEAKNRIVSPGTYIDSIRLAKAIAGRCSINSSDVSALVLGHHGGSLVIDDAFVSISGIPVSSLLSAEEFAAVAQEVQGFNHDFLQLTKRNYPYYGPAAACVSLINSMVNTAPQILPLSSALGDETIAIGRPHYVYGQAGSLQLEEKTISYSQASQSLLDTAKNEVAAIVKELL